MAKIYAIDEETGRRQVFAIVCSKCYQEAIDSGMTEAEIAATMDGNGQDRFSFGIPAGHYCEEHWRKSGYRDATDPDAEFDPMDAGERLEPDDP